MIKMLVLFCVEFAEMVFRQILVVGISIETNCVISLAGIFQFLYEAFKIIGPSTALYSCPEALYSDNEEPCSKLRRSYRVLNFIPSDG